MDVMIVANLLAFAGGLALLWWAGDLVVHYAVSVAVRFHVTTFFVGFVILAMASDIPELAVAVSSALRGVSEVSAGDIIGANFSDIAFVLGLTLLAAGSIGVSRYDRKKLLQLLGLVSVIMLTVFAIGTLTKLHGIVLISIYLVFMLWGWYRKGDEHGVISEPSSHEGIDAYKHSKLGLAARLLGSLGLVLGSSMMIVHSAVSLATWMCIPLEVVGATILGMGTSLPELAASLSALRRKEYGLALGPTLGTVLCQGTLVLGILALISEKPVNLEPLRGAAVFMFISFFIISYSLLRERIGRVTGVALLSLFLCYWAYHFFPSMMII